MAAFYYINKRGTSNECASLVNEEWVLKITDNLDILID